MKDLINITDKQLLEFAIIVLFHPSIEDFQSDDVLAEDVEYLDATKLKISVSMRCWVGFIIVDEATGEIYLLDEDEEEREEIFQPEKAKDYLISEGFNINKEVNF